MPQHPSSTSKAITGGSRYEMEFTSKEQNTITLEQSKDSVTNELFTMPSPLDGKEGDAGNINGQDDCTGTTCSDSRCSVTSHEDAIARKVGLKAHEYLEERFYTEVSVLNREKFNSIPEVTKSDFKIKVS